jgi:hypothetical protein
MLYDGKVDDFYTPEEMERYTTNNWDGYRFVLSNAIGYLFTKEEIPLIIDLIRDERHGDTARSTLVEFLRKKLKRWRRRDPEALTLFKEIASETGYTGEQARKALEAFGKT